jgi:hypothetical protein
VDVFLDESGYSGNNLLDDQQPIFSVATLGLPEAECGKLKQTHFRRSRLPELKHSALARKPSGQQMVRAFFDDVLSRPGAVRCYVLHKRTALVRKFVDHLIEPTLERLGVNLYEGHRQIEYAIVIDRVVPALKGQEYYGKLMRLVHDLLAYRTPEALEQLRTFVCICDTVPQVEQLLLPAKIYLSHAGAAAEVAAMPADNLDLSLAVALPVMSLWREDAGSQEPIHLYHDRSSAMGRQSAWWAYLTAGDREAYGAVGSSIRFPIALDRTDFVDSHNWAGIQLSDVLAGGFRRAFEWSLTGQEDKYARWLFERIARAPERGLMTMLPGEKPERLNQEDGNEVVELVGKFFGAMNQHRG